MPTLFIIRDLNENFWHSGKIESVKKEIWLEQRFNSLFGHINSKRLNLGKILQNSHRLHALFIHKHRLLKAQRVLQLQYCQNSVLYQFVGIH